MALSAATASSAAMNRARMSSFIALRFSGRFSTSVAMPSSTSMSTRSVMIISPDLSTRWNI
jgi:hypothetical protein